MTVQRTTTDADAATALPRSPLEQLEDVINEVGLIERCQYILLSHTHTHTHTHAHSIKAPSQPPSSPTYPLSPPSRIVYKISNDQAYMVKRELLVGLVPDSAASLRGIQSVTPTPILTPTHSPPPPHPNPDSHHPHPLSPPLSSTLHLCLTTIGQPNLMAFKTFSNASYHPTPLTHPPPSHTRSPTLSPTISPTLCFCLTAIGQPNIMASKTFFGQKPLNFDALTGSITVSSSPGVGSSFQFLIRDNAAARQDLLVAKVG